MSSFWVICERQGGPLTLRLLGAGETLPVFSFVEEADLYLRSETVEDGSWIEEVACKELISLLSDPRLDIEQVALDPPGRDDVWVRLLSVGREAFLRFLLRRARNPVLFSQMGKPDPTKRVIPGNASDKSKQSSCMTP